MSVTSIKSETLKDDPAKLDRKQSLESVPDFVTGSNEILQQNSTSKPSVDTQSGVAVPLAQSKLGLISLLGSDYKAIMPPAPPSTSKTQERTMNTTAKSTKPLSQSKSLSNLTLILTKSMELELKSLNNNDSLQTGNSHSNLSIDLDKKQGLKLDLLTKEMLRNLSKPKLMLSLVQLFHKLNLSSFDTLQAQRQNKGPGAGNFSEYITELVRLTETFSTIFKNKVSEGELMALFNIWSKSSAKMNAELIRRLEKSNHNDAELNILLDEIRRGSINPKGKVNCYL